MRRRTGGFSEKGLSKTMMSPRFGGETAGSLSGERGTRGPDCILETMTLSPMRNFGIMEPEGIT
jgi:hypothetical protein